MTVARIVLASTAEFELRLRAAMPELNGNLQRWAGPLAGSDPSEPVRALMSVAPDVVAFGPDLGTTETVLAMADHLDRLYPHVEVVVIAEPSPVLWERAARAGVRELVSPLAADDELRSAVRRAAATAVARRNGAAVATTTTVAEPQVVVIRSPKGGSGKTMLATNLAVVLAQAHPGEVALVDLDLAFGDVASALGLDPSYTIADATANDELTPTSLKALLTTHSSHLCVLCGPVRPTEADEITADDVTAVLALLTTAFRYVVVDTPGGADARTAAALGTATDILLVCSMDVSSVRALHKEMAAAAGRDDAIARRHVVLNRADSHVALDVLDIEATIGTHVDARVSSTRAVPLHMNCGLTLVEAEPSSPVTAQIRQLAARIDAAVATAPRTGARRWRRPR